MEISSVNNGNQYTSYWGDFNLYKVLLVGLGVLGLSILRELAKFEDIMVYAGDIDVERCKEAVNLIINGTVLSGYKPHIEFIKVDLTDVDSTKKLIKNVSPDVICNATTLISWWYPHILPDEFAVKVARCGVGPWTPCHLALTYNLMRAVKESGVDTRVVNTSYNDVVSPALAKVGLAPYIGGGNLDLIVPIIKRYIAERENASIKEVNVYLIAHHGFLTDPDKAPYILKVYIRGKEVSIGDKEFRDLIPRHYKIEKRWTGPPEQYPITCSFVKNLLAVLRDLDIFTHSPGALGLPGGYPVRLNRSKVELALPADVSKDEAIKVNEGGAKCDGIEEIKSNGSIVLTKEASEMLKDVFGLDYRVYKLENAYEDAMNLRKAYIDIMKKYGIKPPYVY